jgi:hypothetical protein
MIRWSQDGLVNDDFLLDLITVSLQNSGGGRVGLFENMASQDRIATVEMVADTMSSERTIVKSDNLYPDGIAVVSFCFRAVFPVVGFHHGSLRKQAMAVVSE